MNNKIYNYLQAEINEKKISHAFLVSTNDCEKVKEQISQIMIKNGLIPNQKLENNIAVSVIKPENNIIDKNKILELQKFIITKSIINKTKVYFIINAELMNISAFNKLLKVLEEPSENVIGFLITENENAIIPTIKSRCKRFNEMYEDNEQQDFTNIINKFNEIKKMKYLEIINFKNELLKFDKNQITSILKEYKNKILNEQNQIDNLKDLANIYKILDNIISLIKSNVNIELCLDKMIVEMRK